jgi:hypothetical protein
LPILHYLGILVKLLGKFSHVIIIIIITVVPFNGILAYSAVVGTV